MNTPYVNPVGLVETPDEPATPRRFSGRQQILAWALLSVFVAATLVTTVVGAGVYCLTTDAGDTRALQAPSRGL